MKVTDRLILLIVVAWASTGASAWAEKVKASLAATRGAVAINGSAAGSARPLPVKVGSVIKPGLNSGAILIPVPGQTIFVDQNTEVQLTSCEMSASKNSVWSRHSAFKFKNGRIHCSIAHLKTGDSRIDVTTPKASMSAHGTSWATWSDAEGTQIAVYAGVVTIHFGGVDIDVLYGQVATITGEGDAAVLEIVDLKTGRFVRYTAQSSGKAVALQANPGEWGLASAAQLRVARDLFEEGFGAFRGTASEGDILAFSQIVATINQVLADNLLPPLNPPFEWQLWPDWDRLRSPFLAPLASPEKPIE